MMNLFLEEHTPPILSEKINFQQSVHFSKVSSKVKSLEGKLNSAKTSKGKSPNTEGYRILTDEVLYITYAETHTYTFKAVKEQSVYLIENIVLHYNLDTQSYDEYLIQYDLSFEEYYALYDGSLFLDSEKVIVTKLDDGFFESNSEFNKGSITAKGGGCSRVSTTIFVSCSSTEHDENNLGDWGNCTASQLPYAYQSYSTVCTGGIQENEPEEEVADPSSGTGGVTSANLLYNPLPLQPCDEASIGDVDDDGNCITIMDVAVSEIASCIGSDITASQISFLRSTESTYQIQSYLNLNGCNPETKDFALLAIEALRDDGEVDFDDNLILSKEFKDNVKLKCVYDKLAGDNSSLFRDTVGTFIDNPNVNLLLAIGDCQGAAGACTQDQYLEETGIITIKIENINETPIEIAQMIIHEAIHAELAKYVLERDSNVDTNDKPRLFELYKFYRESGVPEKHIDHPYMALNYITPIASALRQFDNNRYPIDYYKSLAWIGLEDFDVNAVLTDPLINTYSQYLSTIIQNTTVCN